LACTNYLGANGIHVYDGVINDMRLNLSYFYRGMELKNLEYNDSYLDYLNGTCITSCYICIGNDDCVINFTAPVMNNSYRCIFSRSSTIKQFSDRPGIFMNNYESSIILSAYTLFISLNDSIDPTTNISLIVNCNQTGIYLDSGYIITKYAYITNNDCGVFNVNNSYVFNSNSGYSYFINNNKGVHLSRSSMGMDYVKIYDNDKGIVAVNSNVTNGKNSGVDIYNNTIGIAIYDNSYISLSHANIHNNDTGVYCRRGFLSAYQTSIDYNTSYGIHMEFNSNLHLDHCSVSNNSSYGFFTEGGTTSNFTYTNVNNNGDWGVRLYKNCTLYVFNYGQTISGNGTYDMVVNGCSQVDIHTHNAVANTTPSKNTAPSYSDARYGSYILEYLI
jgi:hypothetical protein